MISIKTNIKDALKQLSGLQKKQIPFAQKETLNALAKRAKTGITNAMQRSFDRPTQWTLNSLRIQYATVQKIQAKVALKDAEFAGKGVPPSAYLNPQIHSGLRHAKSHELSLRRVLALNSGTFMVPGDGAILDSFGNMSRGQINKILSYFAANRDVGTLSNLTAAQREKKQQGTKRRAGISYMVARAGNPQGLQPGIYERKHLTLGVAIKPVLIFVKAPYYRKRLAFREIAENIVKAHATKEFEYAYYKAVKTAR